MKIKTAWRVLAFSAVFGLGLIGCGGNDNPSGGDNYNGGNNNNNSNNNNGGSNNNGGGGSSETVMLGGLKWMTKNLDVETEDSWCYGEGGQVLVGEDWVTLTSSQIQANCTKYGRLYTWEAAKIACQLVGKRLPTNQEWEALVTAAGGSSTAGRKLKSTSGWNNNGNGTNDFGFSALPGGFRDSSSGNFGSAGNNGYWWTATENGSNAYYRNMYYNDDDVDENGYYKSHGFSARCVE
ncbi:MAG: hypothetical protein LBC59_01025 [Chitinispirillales bacterium]|jgi:uncharacterized protein (TIGR02145 family)|nr:hypothetical protein [Chitinispirillales bacterium]